MYDTFIVSQSFFCSMMLVRSRWSRHVNFIWFSRARSSTYFVLLPLSFFFFWFSFCFLSVSVSFFLVPSYFLCSCSFMVDYFLVRSDCPYVSFFFARLCGLLESIGRKHPQVGCFVGSNCPFRGRFSFPFPFSSSFSRHCSNFVNG